MAKELLYLPSNKNVSKLFERILEAKQPDTFNHPYMQETIGLKGTADRALISMLKTLGFIDASGKPNASYALLKNKSTAGAAIADAVRRAYAPLFEANERANELGGDELKGLIAQTSGTDSDATNRIFYTFQALTKAGDFKAKPPSADKTDKKGQKEEAGKGEGLGGALRPDFHYNIQIHLPSNGTEETYLNIFNAVRKTFQ